MVEHESEWDDALPVAEMFYNNATSSSSLKSPYEVVYGHPMRLHFDSLCTKSGTPAAEHLLERLQRIWSEVRSNLEKASAAQKLQADRHRRDMPLQVGERYWLSTKNLPLKGVSRKF